MHFQIGQGHVVIYTLFVISFCSELRTEMRMHIAHAPESSKRTCTKQYNRHTKGIIDHVQFVFLYHIAPAEKLL